MTWFVVSDESEAIVNASREDVWAILTDPEALVRMTPLVRGIDVDGDHWIWKIGSISALGQKLEPHFTEKMTFTEKERIEFRHDPPQGKNEPAGVDGSYELADADGGTKLAINFTVGVRLPLPNAAARPVRGVVEGVLSRMGNGFAEALEKELAQR